MFKNVATKIALFAFDTTTGAAKTGDAANITAYVAKDYGATTVLADTSATEQDATNAKGWYLFDVAQAEANGDALLFTAKSTTANVSVVGQYIFTTPNRFTTLVIDAAGLADANAVKVGPTGAGTAQTAGDIVGKIGAPAGASLSADVAAVKVDTAAVKVQTDKFAFTVTNQVDCNVLDWKSATAPAMTGDAFARIGAAGAGLTALGDTRIANLDATVSSRTKPADTQAAVTLVTTTTNLTNAPTAGDLTATMKASVTTAATAATPTAAAVTGAVGSVTGLTASDVGAIKAKTDNLPATPAAQGDCITGAGVRTAVGMGWANLDTQLGLIAGYIDTEIGTLQTTATAIKLKTDNLPSSPAAVGDIPTAAANADAVWDEAIAGHVAAGSTGEALSNAGAAGTPPTIQDIVDGMLDEAIVDHQDVGSVGRAISDAGAGGNPWDTAMEGAFTFGDGMKIAAGVAAGKTTVTKTGKNSATVAFRALADDRDIVIATMDHSQRTAVALDP